MYSILIEFGIPKKLVRLIKMCLTETYSRVRVGKNLSEMFPIRNGLKQGDANYVQNFVQHPALKVNSICRGNYWGSSMWILMQ